MRESGPLLIIDGYNAIMRRKLLPKNSGEKGLEQARDRLLLELSAFRSAKNIRILVIFDGRDEAQPHNTGKRYAGVVCRFSRFPQTADDLIKEVIDHHDNRRQLTLITSDLRLAGVARAQGVNHLTVEEFYRRLGDRERESMISEKHDVKMSRAEVQEWLAIFAKSEKKKEE